MTVTLWLHTQKVFLADTTVLNKESELHLDERYTVAAVLHR